MNRNGSPMLGRFPLPVEVEPFGLAATRRAVEAACAAAGSPGPGDAAADQGRPRFRHGWRALDSRWRAAADRRSEGAGGAAVRDPGRHRARIVHWACDRRYSRRTARACAWSSDRERQLSTGEEHRHVCQDQRRRRYGRSGARRVACARAGRRRRMPAHAQQKPSPAAVKIAREILDLKNAAALFEPMVPGVIERVKACCLQTNPTLRKDLDEVAANLRKVYAPRTAELLNEIAVALCVALHRSRAQGARHLLPDADRQEGRSQSSREFSTTRMSGLQGLAGQVRRRGDRPLPRRNEEAGA